MSKYVLYLKVYHCIDISLRFFQVGDSVERSELNSLCRNTCILMLLPVCPDRHTRRNIVIKTDHDACTGLHQNASINSSELQRSNAGGWLQQHGSTRTGGTQDDCHASSELQRGNAGLRPWPRSSTSRGRTSSTASDRN